MVYRDTMNSSVAYVQCDNDNCEYETEFDAKLSNKEIIEELEKDGWYIDGEIAFCSFCVNFEQGERDGSK